MFLQRILTLKLYANRCLNFLNFTPAQRFFKVLIRTEASVETLTIYLGEK